MITIEIKTWVRTVVALWLCAATPYAAAQTPVAISAGTHDETLMVDGRLRHYRVYVPASADTAAPSLVVALHGGNSNGAAFEAMTGLSALADRAGFVVVYPNAIGLYRGKPYWNDGRVPAVDDVGFIRRLIDELAHKYQIDRARVYVTGFSNGASMTNRLGVELGDRIAAIAPVAGTLGIRQARSWQPLRVLPVLYFHGTTDPFAYYSGGSAGTWKGSSLSAPDYAAWWALKNGCDPQPQETALSDRIDDGTSIKRVAYSCPVGADVVFYSIDNGGHTWPGGAPWAPEAITGKISREIDASSEMWHFFQQHRLQAAR